MISRRALGALGLVAALIFANVQLVGLERLHSGGGRDVLMPLAPVDPLSYVQGRYVALRYRLDNPDSLITTPVKVDGEAVERWRMWPRVGQMAVTVGVTDTVTAMRLHVAGVPLAPDELLWRYRKDGSNLHIGTDAWFCPEEQCTDLERDARFGVFRVDARGRVILVGLANADRALIATPPPRWWTGRQVATATPTP